MTPTPSTDGNVGSERDELVRRVRALLGQESPVREVSMFGGRSIMVREKMVVSALRGGDLLVRVAAERHDELTARPGASQAEMGPGRDMGPGWIDVSSASIASDDELTSWLEVALEHNRVVTGPST